MNPPTVGKRPREDMRKPLLRAILLLVGVSVLGTAGYMLLEGWTLIDAAYMTAIR